MSKEISGQKLRGGYYTPHPIAEFIARWTIQSGDNTVLEPSCGDGVFLKCAASRLSDLGLGPKEIADRLQGVEIIEEEADQARERLRSEGIPADGSVVKTGDFFEYCRGRMLEQQAFDTVIGNPPFIRFQNFPDPQQEIAMGLLDEIDLNANRLTNTWLPFLVGSSLLLNDHGRIGMIIPAELLQVSYAADLRKFLSSYYRNIVLVTFEKLVFEGIQQEVVLFLGERDGSKAAGIRVVELNDIEDLRTYDHQQILDQQVKPMDHTQEKWTQYFLDKEEILLLRELRDRDGIRKGRDVLDADVGVVTGQNSFFILNKGEAEEHGLEDYCREIVTRSGHFDGIVFSRHHWESNYEEGLPCLLLDIPPEDFEELPGTVQRYIRYGEEEEIHTGYKCRNRDPWYTVPSVWEPDGFMLRQIHKYPRVIVNRADATSTDTIHRVKITGEYDIEAVASALLNSLTFAFSEVLGRSYGGGVLEMYPTEIDKLPIPLTETSTLDVDRVHKILQDEGVGTVLELTDQELLVDALGFSELEVRTLRDIWRKLRDRRIERR